MPSLSREDPSRRFAALILTVLFTALGLVIIATACWLLVPPLAHTPAFDAQFTVLPGFLYAGQPAKSAAFEACCLAVPFLLFFSFRASGKLTANLSTPVLRRIVAAGLVLHLLVWAACVLPVFYCPHPPLWIAPRWLLVPSRFPPPVPGWQWMVSLAFGAALILFFFAQSDGRRARNRVMFPVLLFWLLLAPTRFLAPSEITDQLPFTYALNSVLDALSQAAGGHHLLVDFPHIYGGYVEMLGLVLRLFPRTPEAPLLALAVPSALAVLFLLLTARLIIRPPLILLLAGLALSSFAFLVSIPDPNYGYVTARGAFPALGLFCAALHFQKPGRGRYLLASLVAALAPLWNLDTGLVLWGGWTATLLAGEMAARRWSRAGLHLAIQFALFLAAWASFFLYFRLASGAWPDLHLLFYFQSMVVQSGYFCVALLVPNVWISVVLLYLVGLAVAFGAHLRGPVDREARMVLLLSLLGLGTFSYYMGRSAETNLISVGSPAVLLLGLLAGKARTAIRRRRVPALAGWFLLPWVTMASWWIFLLFAQLPMLLARGPQLVHDWRATTVTPFEANAGLVKSWIPPHEPDVYFLSSHSGFYYYLTQTVRSLRIPGNVELLRTRDMDVLLSAIQDRRIARLVVEQNFYDIEMYRPDVYADLAAAIAQNYRPLEKSPSDRLILYVPRPDPAGP